MSNVVDLTDSSFETAVADGVTLVDFWAPWCGPCRLQHPILDEVSQEVANEARVTRVNVDECPNLASRFQIQSIPTLVLLKDGEEVSRRQGITQANELIEEINKVQ
jgi:thioredoxin 1